MKKFNIYKSYRLHYGPKSSFDELVKQILYSFTYNISKIYDNIYIDCYDIKGNIVNPVFLIRETRLSESEIIAHIEICKRNYKIDKLLYNNI